MPSITFRKKMLNPDYLNKLGLSARVLSVEEEFDKITIECETTPSGKDLEVISERIRKGCWERES